jgi:hypothetical protein
MLFYVYDIKIKDKKTRNAVKRRFYYNLNKKFKNVAEKKTRSSILINEKFESKIDDFFNEFYGFIDVYKIRAESVERLLEVTPPY